MAKSKLYVNTGIKRPANAKEGIMSANLFAYVNCKCGGNGHIGKVKGKELYLPCKCVLYVTDELNIQWIRR